MRLSKKNPLTIIVTGPAGSGKGTQAKLLCKKFGLEYVGSGDVLRNRQKKGDFTGKKLAMVMNKGALVPSLMVADLWVNELERLKTHRKEKNGLVLDGWTRTILEVKLMDEALEWYEWDKNVKVILIDISRKESFDRLTKRRQCKKCGQLIPWMGEFKKFKKCNKCGGELFTRPDDKIESIKKRLDEYEKETVLSINYYKKQARLIRINGEQSIENVFKDILKALKI